MIDSYKYFGVFFFFFSKSGSFVKAKTHIIQQANNSMFYLDLPLDLQ